MAPLNFDYSNGSAVVQNGVIYYSPNCTRPVIIPSRPVLSSDPFRQSRLNASMFRQPVWWSYGWAWQSFVPLAPSFVFTPFEALCAMPHIEEVEFSFDGPSGQTQREIRFRMNECDIRCWFMEEERIVKVARAIQLRYGIPGSLPPKPSSFHFDRAHKTHKIAKRMICLSREWFAIWMGFVSYFIAKTESLFPNGEPDNSSPAPDWYNHLRNEHNFSDSWLDGLLLSNVCSFDLGTLRAGIIFQWSEENSYRESIEWFYNHHIPLWFVWSSTEEQAISNKPSLAYLRPPNYLIQQALTMLLSVPNVPLAGLILQQYYKLGNDPVTNKTIEFLALQHAPSFVFEFTVTNFLGQEDFLKQTRLGRTQKNIDADLTALKASLENQRQAAADAASTFPYHGLLATKFRASAEAAPTSPDAAWTSPGAAWTSPDAAWTSPEDAWSSVQDSWPSAEASSSAVAASSSSSSYHGLVTNVEIIGKVYNHYNDFFAAREKRQKEMMKVESPRDRQARESRARNPGVKNAKVFEWEKTQSSGGWEVYQRIKVNKKRNEDVYCFYEPHQRLFNAFANEWDLCHDFSIGNKDGQDSDSDDDYDDQHYPEKFVSQPTSFPPSTAPMVQDVVEPDVSSAAPTLARDPLETLSLVYGYLPRSGADDAHSPFDWDAILMFLGFIHNLEELDVPEPEKSAMKNFFRTIVSKAGANDIETGFENLKGFFPCKHIIQRPSEDLFVFSSPRSSACQWVLGVHSPVAALYVCRYILGNPHIHTILTVAHNLLDNGIPFRTLLPLTCSPRQLTVTEPYTPRTYRLLNHTFTTADFNVAMLACQSVLTSSQGRAALLRGGIVGRIAKEYLSIDGVLDGPSVEVTAHRVGYIAPSGNSDNTRFCDDQLTDNEIAIICGTYSLYTGKFLFSFAFFPFSNLFFTAVEGQVAKWTWFPPPEVWEKTRVGCNWFTWTERCEDIFQNILFDARADVGKPKSVSEWVTFLRGQQTARFLISHNKSRSQAFIDRVLPVGS
jgi:hypothetical protein